MTVTKQQQLEWLASSWTSWHTSARELFMSKVIIGCFMSMIDDSHQITLEEWQQERDKMQKQQDNSWHERGELPPVGCECEVFDGDDWLKSFIVGRSRSGDVVVQTRNGYFEASHAKFRPLRTEREKAIDEMADLIAKSVFGSAKCQAEKLYDAGYRKVKP